MWTLWTLVTIAGLALGVGVLTAGDSPTPTQQGDQVCVLKVEGMTCGGCEAAVKMAAKSVAGVKAVSASHQKGVAEVTYDPSRTTPEAIAKAITEKSGFKTTAPQKPASSAGPSREQ